MDEKRMLQRSTLLLIDRRPAGSLAYWVSVTWKGQASARAGWPGRVRQAWQGQLPYPSRAPHSDGRKWCWWRRCSYNNGSTVRWWLQRVNRLNWQNTLSLSIPHIWRMDSSWFSSVRAQQLTVCWFVREKILRLWDSHECYRFIATCDKLVLFLSWHNKDGSLDR